MYFFSLFYIKKKPRTKYVKNKQTKNNSNKLRELTQEFGLGFGLLLKTHVFDVNRMTFEPSIASFKQLLGHWPHLKFLWLSHKFG